MQKKVILIGLIVIIGAVVLIFGGQAASAQADAAFVAPVNQLIIKYKADANLTDTAQAQAADQMQRLSTVAGTELAYFRPMSGQAHVLRLPEFISEKEAREIAKRLLALPEVEYAEPDSIFSLMGEVPESPLVVPNDARYNEQWHYFAPTAGNYGVNAPAAWNITMGSSAVFVAVLDTGITNHADLSGRWQGGYDMVSDTWMANDGGGRDSDPHDPGDWVAANACYSGSSARNSSWHGTHVAGTIGAATNNSVGVAGLNWVSKVIPVRVLGRCGGTLSDIADGISWAAGLSVPGAPANPYPAKVINMSLGGYGTCDATYQNAITAAYNAGSMVVVSAGNSADNAANYRPANCNNVVTVAATDRYGNLANYSNYGTTVEISAPGGETNVYGDGVLSTLNNGTTTPASDIYQFYQGTSMAAPHISGVASLIYSLDPSLTPAEVLLSMQSTVTVFPGGSSCNTSNCGSGIVNAAAALAAVSGPPAPVLSPISNSDGDGNYMVSWVKGTTMASDVASPSAALSPEATLYKIYLPLVMKNYDGTAYTLQEASNSSFTSPTTVYNGTNTSWNATGKSAGTYYYRVMASNSEGDSPWSNIQSVTVGGGTSGIVNGNFESGSSGWVEYSTHGWDIIVTAFPTGVTPRSGSYAAWLGGEYDDTSYVQQQVTISAGTPYLVYWHWIASSDACGFDFGGVLVNGSVADQYDLCSSANTGGWVKHSVNLSAYIGQSVTVQIRVETDSSLNSNLYVDDVALQSSALASGQINDVIPYLDASTTQGKLGIVGQGENPQGLNEKRLLSP